MPLLIRNISANILDNHATRIPYVDGVTGQFGYGDWFMLGNIEVFIQDFRRVSELEQLAVNNKYGLIINNGVDFIEFEISY